MLKYVYQINFITALSLFISLSCFSQTDLEKSKIYNAVLETITDKTTPILDQTFPSIESYEIDSSYNHYNYETNGYQKEDYKPTKIRFVCVVPIMRYRSLSISGYLHLKNILTDTAKLFEQAENRKTDTLSKYVSNNMLFMLKPKRGIVSRSISKVIGKLRRKNTRNFFIVSNLLFDKTNNIAFVKYQKFPKENVRDNYTDKIIVLNKIGEEWKVIDTLD